jgi:hypothetical protein
VTVAERTTERLIQRPEGDDDAAGAPPRKPPGRPFPKGVSGNPGGRHKAPFDMVALARSMAPDALETLGKIMRSDKAPPSSRVTAAGIILDRGYGKAPATIQVQAQKQLADMTDDELVAIAQLARSDGVQRRLREERGPVIDVEATEETPDEGK